jgi:uncharacterized membrane protein
VDRRGRRAVAWAGVLALIFVAGTFLAPVLSGAGSVWGGALHLAYAPLCHQLPERSLVVGAGTQAVCARCSGLYLGGVAGLGVGALLMLRRRLRPRPRWLAVALAPSMVDFVLPWLGLPSLSNVPRLVLAIPAGVVVALFLAVGIEDLFSRASRIRLPIPFVQHESRAVEETDG